MLKSGPSRREFLERAQGGALPTREIGGGFFLQRAIRTGNPNIIQHMILARVTPDLQIPRPGTGTGTDPAAIHGRATIAF
jgi:hypothetical protein